MPHALFLPFAALLSFGSLAYAVLGFMLLRGLAGTARRRSSEPSRLTEKPSVTVLIAARNEAGRIEKCLDCLLRQDYPADKLQVVVVDDRSEDRTPDILREYQNRRPGLIFPVAVSESNPAMSPKKFALSRGMLHANGDIIVTTDADCVMPPNWIRSLIGEFDADTGLVLGLTAYLPPAQNRSGVSWGAQAVEFFSYNVAAAGLVGLGFPVSGNANNMAYRREAFDAAQGFAVHGRVVSGDDDFLIQAVHKLGNWKIKYSSHPGARVETAPPESLREFWEQRKRWAGKCSLYQPKQTAFLAGIYGYYALIVMSLGLGFVYPPCLWMGVTAYAVKTGADYAVMRAGGRLFDKKDLLAYFPLAALLHLPLVLAAVPAGSFGTFTWKGRTTRRRL